MVQSSRDETGSADKAGKRSGSWTLRLFVIWPFYAAVVLAIIIGGSFIHYTVAFPNPRSLRANETAPVIRILARGGALLAQRGKAHGFVPLDALPQQVIDAVIATEDRRFYRHFGLDPLGLLRASFTNMRAGRYVQGGSTLTQQLAKNLFLTPKRTLSRKFQELLIALWLEVRLTKTEILELYLNRVYFGGGAYGIEAAARRYFGKSATKLDVTEAALIAGLLKAPSRYSPRANPGLARSRARTVLRKMRSAGFLSEQQYTRSRRRSLRFANSKTDRASKGLEYAIDYALERLPAIVGTEKGALIVETTIDARLQRRAQKVVSRFLRVEGIAARADQAAVAILDAKGAIVALVGGRSYASSQYNRAASARRQPGSAFKPVVYLAALENGRTPASTAYDRPIKIKGWSPRNFGGRYRGKVSLRQALVHSINSVAVRLYMDVGASEVISTARRLGIKSDLHDGPSLALGTSEVSLLEMTGAYAVFANGGSKSRPHIIRRIKTSSGEVLYVAPAAPGKRIVASRHVGAMNDMLNAALVSGTGKRAALADHPAAGKTGTSQDFRDAWFIGYTAHYVAGVWVGNDSGKAMNKVTGGGLPARIWRKLMGRMHAGLKPKALPGTTLISPPRRQAPRLPKERIGEDFIARALGGSGSPGYRAEPRQGPPPGYNAQIAGGPGITQVDKKQVWWSSGFDTILQSLGIATNSGAASRDYMSLGAPK